MPKSAEERIALWMMERSYATGHGDTIEDLLAELEAHAKAAAIREDRAEMVSEDEVEAACKAWSGTWGHEFPGELQGSDIHDHAANCMRHTMRGALDAARKAKAG